MIQMLCRQPVRGWRWLLSTLFALFAFSLSAPLCAQTIEDGCLLPEMQLLAGVSYSHDSWDEYWEGTLKRTNGNIGTITTQTFAINSVYGVNERFNLIASAPYVKTRASQGVLHDMEGFQDFTLAGKYNILETAFTEKGRLKVIGVLAGSIPMSDYTPDYMPLSIGSASKRVSARTTVNFEAHTGWFVNGSAAYTWRQKVELDRPYYYTDGKLYMTNEVAMPSVLDYSLISGYMKGRFMAELFYSQQATQGGGDIRRQDMPFVSNRMNATRVGAMVVYPLPPLPNLELQLSYAHVTRGRNVGQSDTISTGVQYRFDFKRGHASTGR